MPIYIEGICKRLNHEANIMVNIVGLFITQNVHYLHFKFLDPRASSTAVWSAFFSESRPVQVPFLGSCTAVKWSMEGLEIYASF